MKLYFEFGEVSVYIDSLGTSAAWRTSFLQIYVRKAPIIRSREHRVRIISWCVRGYFYTGDTDCSEILDDLDIVRKIPEETANLIPYPVTYTHINRREIMGVPVTKKSAASKPEAARSLNAGGSRPLQ
jgi:hypothetical protein